jgi:threonine dehydrogenase-like Zn-dependent dehydrogenase
MKSVRLSPVRILIVGNSGNTGALAEGLEGAEVMVERWPDDPPPSGGPEEVAAIARELRELERALGEGGPDVVLVASGSSAALAAVLVATKLGTPVGWIGAAGEDPAGANVSLIRLLADAALAPDPTAIVDWSRDTYTDRA